DVTIARDGVLADHRCVLGRTNRARRLDQPTRAAVERLLRRRTQPRPGTPVRDVPGREHRRRVDDRRDRPRVSRRTRRGVVGRGGWAGIGSLVLALWVGPRIRRIAADHDLRTVGDFLEWRYDTRVRTAIAALLWVGTIAILAGQLIGIAWILTVVIGIPKIAGCLIGAIVVTVYFGARGLLSSAVVNVVQLSVKALGFAIALPI